MNQRGITDIGWTEHAAAAVAPADALDERQAQAQAELLARIGVTLGAQRTEVFAITEDGRALTIVGWWTALGHEPSRRPDPDRTIPVDWFPWSLGNIRPTDYVFVRNAAPLPLQPDSSLRIRDLAMGSSLHLPIREGLRLRGGVCVYWATERETWDDTVVHRVTELGARVLD